MSDRLVKIIGHDRTFNNGVVGRLQMVSRGGGEMRRWEAKPKGMSEGGRQLSPLVYLYTAGS